MRFFTSMLAMVLATVACSAVTAEEAWTGRYQYVAELGKSSGGSPILIEHTLSLRESEPGCFLVVQGYQVDETIHCSVDQAASRATIRFQSYANGETTNKYGVAVHEPGAALFSMRRANDTLLTRWLEYSPGESIPPVGEYFTRTPR